MPDWLNTFIETMFSSPVMNIAEAIWNWIMGLCTGVITTSPQDFSPETWNFVTNTLYPWALAIGVCSVNLFFIIGFLKAVSSLKENITLELCIEAMIRLIAVNVLLHVGIPLVQTFFTMASLLGGQVMISESPDFFTGDFDPGVVLFNILFGFGYAIVALVCAILIFLTLYGRYIKLYLLLIFYPLAMPSLTAGRGIDETAKAWIRAFLSNTFEIVVIALVMAIAGRIIGDAGTAVGNITDFFDGFGQAFRSMIYMILMASSVKGASAFMNKTFHL